MGSRSCNLPFSQHFHNQPHHAPSSSTSWQRRTPPRVLYPVPGLAFEFLWHLSHWAVPPPQRAIPSHMGTKTSSLCSLSPWAGSCFLQLLISALGVQEAVTNIQVTLSFLSAVYPIRCIESTVGNTLHNFLFSCSFHTIVNTHLQSF